MVVFTFPLVGIQKSTTRPKIEILVYARRRGGDKNYDDTVFQQYFISKLAEVKQCRLRVKTFFYCYLG